MCIMKLTAAPGRTRRPEIATKSRAHHAPRLGPFEPARGFLETTQLSESWVQQMKPEVQTCDIFAIHIASRGIHWVYLPEEAEP